MAQAWLVRILLLVDCYLPSTKSSAKLMHDLALEFSERGHDVVLATPDDTLKSSNTISKKGNLTVFRVRTGQIKQASHVRRAINELLLSPVFVRAGRRFFRDHPCELIVYYSPTIFLAGL